MTRRFLYYVLKQPLMLLVDCETGVEYLTTLYSQIPVMDKEGGIVLTGLPRLPVSLDKDRKKEYGRELKKRFTFQVENIDFVRRAYLVTDQQTGVEYFFSRGTVTPLLTETAHLKIKENE
ncbi:MULTISPECIES: hypothetical protein [unclassified Streptococcus]|uniref:hypothetical protein n=1 Tax=unclassified Streptococcus TaxID=2608887 RepID=UPI0011B36B16|nr:MULTISPECIES: hypothetical protein [unclassified Streptococcus]TWS94090.1 hypothetical protein FRX52_05375 [Streptococcus sp. sy018]TWT14213.1 hypothetical protein FRX51_05060 [Streptococcus sp. sy010]